MPVTSESPSQAAPSSSIFEHYAGFEAASNSPSSVKVSRMTHTRDDSDFSLLSNITASSSSNHSPGDRGRQGLDVSPNTAFPLHSRDHSTASNSSSLRQTVAILKEGVFPPGMQSRRTRLDSDSDASHYDEEGEGDQSLDVTIEGGPFASVPGSRDQSPYHPHQVQQGEEEFSNAQDSPAVPRRISSVVMSPDASSSKSPIPSGTTDPVAGEGKWMGRERKATLVGLGVENLSSTPKGKHEELEKSGEGEEDQLPEVTAGLSPGKKKEMEQESKMTNESEDPNRPKTLKEARALAKERARLRMQAKEASDAGTSPVRAVEAKTVQVEPPRESFQSERSASEYSVGSGEGRGEGETSGMKASGSSEWKVHSRQRATPTTPKEERGEGEGLAGNLGSSATKEDTSNDPTGSRQNSSWAMEDLKSAVGEAIEDVSFTSSATAVPSADTSNEPTVDARLELPRKREGDESSAPSITSFDSARESPARSSAVSSSVPARTAADVNVQPHVVEPEPVVLPSATADYAHTESAPSSKFVPHALHAQQRSTAHNKIARLDVYGKNVPWPAAFNPAAVIEQRRLAPWERARSYAYYCNDLTAIPSGLMVWMEMVQRPAQRITAETAAPFKRHVRGEGTDHSTYAASVRSDATFPTRGDGGRAKELMSNMPATISESPSANMPSNIPYPILVSQPGQTSSPSLDDIAASSVDRPSALGRPGNFFTSLGRKGSTRRTPGSGSMTGFSSLSASSSGTHLRSGRGKSKTSISNPMAMTSSPSTLNNRSGSEPMSSPSEPFSSPSPQASLSKNHLPSSPSFHVHHQQQQQQQQQGGRAPLGPRAAPGTLSYSLISGPDSERERGGSSPYGLSTTGGIYNVPAATASSVGVIASSPTDYSAVEGRSWPHPLASPSLQSVKSSLSYSNVREKSPRSNFAALQPPPVPPRNSSDNGPKKQQQHFASRRGSHQSATPTPAENEALDKLADVLPDAERATLLEYLRRAGGNDLVAIGDYLQAKSKSEGKEYLR